MAFSSSTYQRYLNNEFFTNTTAEDQPTTATNNSLIANLGFVKAWVAQSITGFLPTNNPNFTGSLTSSSGGNITFSNPLSYITTPFMNGNPNFTGRPTITLNSSQYAISTRQIGEIKMMCTSITPPNYLPCNGSVYSPTTYSALFSAIGYAYGQQQGGVNFAVPIFNGYFPLGAKTNASINGSPTVPVSNYATGNGTAGSTNTFTTNSGFGGTSNVETAPVISQAPPHSHSVLDPGHDHGFNSAVSVPSTITPAGVQSYYYPSEQLIFTSTMDTGISIKTSGNNIQATDPSSGLTGVSVSQPFVAVNFYICYA